MFISGIFFRAANTTSEVEQNSFSLHSLVYLQNAAHTTQLSVTRVTNSIVADILRAVDKFPTVRTIMWIPNVRHCHHNSSSFHPILSSVQFPSLLIYFAKIRLDNIFPLSQSLSLEVFQQNLVFLSCFLHVGCMSRTSQCL